MKYIEGKIFTETGFKNGYVKVLKSTILEISLGRSPRRPYQKGLIVPSFINMHTHIGDAFIFKKKLNLPHDIMKLVAPPNGIKHQLLMKCTDEEIILGMKETLQIMVNVGTSCFFDFRENGLHGISLIKKALKHFSITPFILSRPSHLFHDEKEINLLCNNSEGIGLSSISDWDYDDVLNISQQIKKRKKLFALHVSERIREDINKIINIQPDFIIHMCRASRKDLEIIKDEDIPIVICPQSNNFFNIKPPLEIMKKIGNKILLGTDNAMLHSPNLLDEIHIINRLYPRLFTIENLLDMITYIPRKVLNLKIDMHDAPFPISTYTVLDERTLQPLINTPLIREG
jgi:cytosine/adenosine deaminase-related metal-dependent hydrolase